MNRRHDGSHPGAAPHILKHARERIARQPTQMHIMLLAALACLLLGFLFAVPAGPPAYAAPARPHLLSCNGPCIGITNPLYPSDGQLVAEGPVGTTLTVEGVNWPPGTKITVWPAPDAATCTAQLAQPPDFAGSVRVNGVGIADGTYLWPQAANNVNQTYILCAVDGAATVLPTTQSNGITMFTVLSADAPSVTATPTSIIQGQDTTLTISGQNWLPAPQTVTVTVCSDPNHCPSSSIASQTTLSGQDGSFQITLTIKAKTDPGIYFVQAVSSTNQAALKAPPSNAPVQLTVSTPTPTPTATPSPTPTPTPPSSTSHNGKGNTTLLIVLLGMFSLLFLVGGIISIAVYTRSGT